MWLLQRPQPDFFYYRMETKSAFAGSLKNDFRLL